jgi:nitrogen-specific signal transduction histidine kinase
MYWVTMKLNPLNWFKRLSDVGTSELLDRDVNKRITLCNRMSLIAFSAMAVFAALEFQLDMEVLAKLDVILSVLFLIPLYLNHRQLYQAARIIFFFISTLYIFCCSAMQGEGSGIYLAFFTIICLPWVLFTGPLRLQWFFTFIPLCLYTWLLLTDFRPFPQLPEYPTPPSYFIFAIFTAFFLCMCLLRFLDEIHKDYNRRLELLLAKVVEQQEQLVMNSKMAALGEMAAGLAHEINNPLTVIQLASNQFLKVETAAEQQILLERGVTNIQRAVARISRIVEAFRRFADKSKAEDLSEIPINQIVDEALNLCRELIEDKGVRLHVEKDEKNSDCRCNPKSLTQVLLTLIHNSLDFVSVESSKDPSICIRTFCAADYCELEVSDNGPGIPQQIRHRIFEPFFTTKPIGSGVGLGLSLARGLIVSQHGSLEYRPSANGACFVIRLQAVSSPLEIAR